jgi:universal stress protein A
MGYLSKLQRGDAPKHVRRILCPVDFSPASAAAVAQALRMAEAHGAEVEVLHVWDLPSYTAGIALDRDQGLILAEEVQREAAEQLEAFLAAQGPDAAARMHGRLANGDPATVILEAAREAELVIMGAHNESVISQVLLGSVADKVVADAPCPIITLRPDGELEDMRVAGA